MSITSAGGTRWADEANDKLAEFLADLPEDERVARGTKARAMRHISHPRRRRNLAECAPHCVGIVPHTTRGATCILQ